MHDLLFGVCDINRCLLAAGLGFMFDLFKHQEGRRVSSLKLINEETL